MKSVALTQEDLAILKKVLNGPYHVILYGSRAKKTNKKFSDVDLCLKAENPLDPVAVEMLKWDLSDSDLPYLVDLSDYHRLPPKFLEIINREGVFLW